MTSANQPHHTSGHDGGLAGTGTGDDKQWLGGCSDRIELIGCVRDVEKLGQVFALDHVSTCLPAGLAGQSRSSGQVRQTLSVGVAMRVSVRTIAAACPIRSGQVPSVSPDTE